MNRRVGWRIRSGAEARPHDRQDHRDGRPTTRHAVECDLAPVAGGDLLAQREAESATPRGHPAPAPERFETERATPGPTAPAPTRPHNPRPDLSAAPGC